ncbi:E3 ubiquitin-protein ligase TRIM32-like [Branchiostoma floridae x Branchiostoma japonicum]
MMAAREKFHIGEPEEVDLLTCPICLEAFDSDQRKPRSLQCLHTFCHGCLQDFSANKQTLECPTCRHETAVPSQGVKGLPHNFWISNIVQASKPASTASADRKEGEICRVHPDKEVIFLCDRCDVLVCGECVASTHRGHPMTLVSDVLRQKTAEVENVVRACQKHAMQCVEAIETVEKVESDLDSQRGEIVAKIIETREAAITNIDVKERELRHEVEQKHAEKSQGFADCKQRLIQIMDQLVNGIHLAGEAMERKDIQAMMAVTATLESALLVDTRKALAAVPLSDDISLGLRFVPSETVYENIQLGRLKLSTNTKDDGDETRRKQGKEKEQGNNNVPKMVEFTVHRIGKTGGRDGEFKTPQGVCTSGSCCFVVDSGNKRVQALESGGLTGGLFASSRSFSIGWSFWDLLMLSQSSWQPHDVANSNDSVYVTDVQHNMVRQFSTRGNYCGQFGRDMVAKPTYVAVDPNDNAVVVADREGREVGIYSSSGAFYNKFSIVGAPAGISVDKEGQIVVSMEGSSNLSVFSRDGQLIRMTCTEVGAMPGRSCTDQVGNVVVVDNRRKRVLLLESGRRAHARVLLSEVHGLRVPWGVAVVHDGILVSDSEQNCLFYVRRKIPTDP